MTPEKEKETNRNWYALALEIGGTATGWIVIPALIALFAGQWLDQRFHTDPIIFLTLIGLAFITSVIGIIRMAQNYLKKEDEKVNRNP